jgi:transcription initiation factor IIE alpha subunit
LGLTEIKIKELKDKKFDVLYDKHTKEWAAMVIAAHDFAKANISKGQDPLADDILKPLISMLEVNEILRKHQEDRHAKYRRYRESFGEYIVEEFLKSKNKAGGTK